MSDVPEVLDPTIHAPGRLAIISALSECEVADFNFLIAATGLSRGNFSIHMSKLVAAKYVEEKKHFVGRKPRTDYRLTLRGAEAFKNYKLAWRRITGA